MRDEHMCLGQVNSLNPEQVPAWFLLVCLHDHHQLPWHHKVPKYLRTENPQKIHFLGFCATLNTFLASWRTSCQCLLSVLESTSSSWVLTECSTTKDCTRSFPVCKADSVRSPYKHTWKWRHWPYTGTQIISIPIKARSNAAHFWMSSAGSFDYSVVCFYEQVSLGHQTLCSSQHLQVQGSRSTNRTLNSSSF